MKLIVCVNHAVPHHVGGSERVVQQITESMTRDYGIDCHVLTRYANKDVTHNGIRVSRVRQPEGAFIQQVISLKPDHLFIYSDSFCYWPEILQQAESIKCPKSIALVGMNAMRTHSRYAKIFRAKHKQFKVITHSDHYLDYRTCQSLGVPVSVIPNAVDLTEFQDQGFSFREKYDIKTKKIILCVSNFYPGKGQEHLHQVLRLLASERNDFTAVFICTNVNFHPAVSLRQILAANLAKNTYRSKMLVDIPRADTIQAFREADLFAFPSQIEVAPLVVLEAMAAGLPWVSLNVGNVPTLNGGFVITGEKKTQGKLQYTSEMYKEFAARIRSLLDDESLRTLKGEEGRQRILKEFDWLKVKEMYRGVFTGDLV